MIILVIGYLVWCSVKVHIIQPIASSLRWFWGGKYDAALSHSRKNNTTGQNIQLSQSQTTKKWRYFLVMGKVWLSIHKSESCKKAKCFLTSPSLDSNPSLRGVKSGLYSLHKYEKPCIITNRLIKSWLAKILKNKIRFVLMLINQIVIMLFQGFKVSNMNTLVDR